MPGLVNSINFNYKSLCILFIKMPNPENKTKHYSDILCSTFNIFSTSIEEFERRLKYYSTTYVNTSLRMQ